MDFHIADKETPKTGKPASPCRDAGSRTSQTYQCLLNGHREVRRSGNRGIAAIRRSNGGHIGPGRSRPPGTTTATRHRSQHAQQQYTGHQRPPSLAESGKHEQENASKSHSSYADQLVCRTLRISLGPLLQ
jgi:hypothetical protein